MENLKGSTLARRPGIPIVLALATVLLGCPSSANQRADIPAEPRESPAPQTPKTVPAKETAQPPASGPGAGVPAGRTPAPRPSLSPEAALKAIAESLDRGVNWLMAKQNPDGGYGPSVGVKGSSDVGLTAFVLYALARSPRAFKAEDGPHISKALEFLLSRQQPNGAIYDPKDPSLQNYKTSVAILALIALDRVKHAEVIKKAAEFVRSQQFDETRGFARDTDVSYGGVGYGSDPSKSDLSNTQFAAEALYEAGLSGADDFWIRLRVLAARCQNFEEEDPLVRAAGVRSTKDGGFRYAPTMTRGITETVDGDRTFSSYGSMTYAGLKSFLYAQMRKNDPRVQAAVKWIKGHFTVEENPGMATATDPSKGQQGLFYYYHTMAKALSVYGEPTIVDDRGVEHIWAKELGERLASIQKPEGYWDNPAERWLEGIEVLDTSYAVVALTICREELGKYLESRPAARPESGGAAEKAGEKK